MLINEKGLIRAMKQAYRSGGYTVANLGDEIAVYTENWFVLIHRALISYKVLAAIVEHMGVIPEEDVPMSTQEDGEPQVVLREVAADDMKHWRSGERGKEVTMVPVIMQGYQIFQAPGAGACWGVSLYLLDMIERKVAEHTGADVIDGDRLLWAADGEAVVIDSVRKARSGWAKTWERAVWEALEGVDLHIRIVEEENEYIYSGYVIRAELSKSAKEIAPATDTAEAEYEDRITVAMSQRSYVESQLASLTETVDVLVMESLLAE